MYSSNSSMLNLNAANSRRTGSYLASLGDMCFKQKLMGYHLVTFLPFLSVSSKGCESQPARPSPEPSVVILNRRPSYWGLRTTGSDDKITLSMTNAFWCSKIHLSFSEMDCRAHLYAPLHAFQPALGISICRSLIRSVRGAAIRV